MEYWIHYRIYDLQDLAQLLKTFAYLGWRNYVVKCQERDAWLVSVQTLSPNESGNEELLYITYKGE